MLAFYIIAPMNSPDQAVDRHREFLTARGMVGRVYLSSDGLNAQVSGTTSNCEEYRDFVASEFPDQTLLFKEDPVAELAFPKLRVKHKALVPGSIVDLNSRGTDLKPEEWAAMLAESSTTKHVLDVRNGYEWDVGHFAGADRPALDNFAVRQLSL